MKRELTLVSSMLVVVAIVALCIGGCGKKAAETGGEPPSPMGETTGPAPAGEQPSGEAPAGPEAGGGGIGEKLSKLLTSVSPPKSYEMKMIPPAELDEEPVSMLFKMAGGKPAKVKIAHPEGEGWMLADYDAKAMYMYNAKENKAMKMPLDVDQEGKVAVPSDFVDTDATVTGTETVDGVRCWVHSSSVGGETGKVWVSVKDGLPRQVEDQHGITRFEYLRINAVSDSEFELPAGVQVVDMKDMMKPKP